MKISVIVFPGTNREKDIVDALKYCVKDCNINLIFYKDNVPKDTDLIVLPGGFSYSDIIRSGKIASLQPIMKSIKEMVNKGVYIIGICNGFQILCESRLLEGSLVNNNNSQFLCDNVNLSVENNIFNNKGEIINIPVANGEGRYYTDNDTLKKLEDNNQILFKYCDNINGSVNNIAGIINNNIIGMMPHIENAVFPHQKSQDGIDVFNSIIKLI